MKRQRTVLCTLIVALGLGLVMAQDQKASRTPADTQGATPGTARHEPVPETTKISRRSARSRIPFSMRTAPRTPRLSAPCSRRMPRSWTTRARSRRDGRPSWSASPDSSQANEGGKLEVAVESIRFLSPEVAVEEGTATVSGDDGEKPEISRYSVIYVKQDGHWLHARIQDQTPSELSAHDHLKDLEWMLGEWLNESDDELVSTTCSWSDNGSFLIREFDVKIEGKVALSGTQRIGWDPLRKQFRTWVFDSEGGFAEGLVSHDDDLDQWIVQSSGVRADGQPVTVTSVFTPLDPDRIAWQTVERTVGGVAVPGLDQYILVRKPPQPAP